MTVVGVGVESCLRNGTGSVEGCGREACIGAVGGLFFFFFFFLTALLGTSTSSK